MEKFEHIKELINLFCHSSGTPGNEDSVSELAIQELEKYMPVKVDNLGNVIGHMDGNGCHILLDAHIDQIGMVVTSVTHDGFLKVAALGGIDTRVLEASEVTVHGKEKILGIVATTPPHLSIEMEKAPKIDELVIDIGMNKEDAEKNVSVGDRITMRGKTEVLYNDKVVSPTLDNRIGMIVLLEAIRMLKKENITPKLSVVFSVQEETGGSGAVTSSFGVRPDEAIVVDVSFAHAPSISREKCGVLSNGAMIGYSPSLNYKMSKKLTSIAKETNIPHQLEVMGAKTGTNADGIAVSAFGVVTGLISIPQRNMHTASEIIDLKDVVSCSTLIKEYIKERIQSHV